MDAILALDIDKCAEKCDNNADAQPDIPQEALELLQKRSQMEYRLAQANLARALNRLRISGEHKH